MVSNNVQTVLNGKKWRITYLISRTISKEEGNNYSIPQVQVQFNSNNTKC